MTIHHRYSVARASRESDDRVLEWLDLRLQGKSFVEIARKYRVNRGIVVRDCRRVREDDRMCSGERVGAWFP